MDNQFQIRGYQKVDLELNQENSKILTNCVKAFNQNENQCKDLFEKLIIHDDIVKYQPLNRNKIKEKTNSIPERIF